MNANELKNWLPVLQHPEHGEAICEAAGLIHGDTDHRLLYYAQSRDTIYRLKDDLDPMQLAALCFGVLSVMDTTKPSAFSISKTMAEDTVGRCGVTPYEILAAAYRWLWIEVDA